MSGVSGSITACSITMRPSTVNKLALHDGLFGALPFFAIYRGLVVCWVRSCGGFSLAPVPWFGIQAQVILFLLSQAAPPSPYSLLGLSQFTDHSLSLSFHLSPSRFFANLALIRASLLHVEITLGPPFNLYLLFGLAPCSSPFLVGAYCLLYPNYYHCHLWLCLMKCSIRWTAIFDLSARYLYFQLM